MKLSKNKYLIGVILFLLLASWSLFEAFMANNNQLVTMLVAMLGYFIFMVMDRLELSAILEKVSSELANLSQPINHIKALQLQDAYAKISGEIKRMTSVQAFEYASTKVKSAQRMYNTSFAEYAAIVGGPYYQRWLSAIISGVTENDCIIHEVMSSKDRLDNLKEIYRASGLPIKGSYLGFELSGQPDSVRNAPFVEFIIFEDKDGSCEVIFGWTTSNNEFLGNDCFIINDRHVVEYFSKQFRRYEQLSTASFLDK